MRRPLALLIALTLCPAALAQKEHGFDNRKGSGQPYLTPAESLAKLTVPPEFEAKLFAGEPQVVNPVAFTIDERGRVWLIECFEYPSRTPKGKAPRDRIVILEDTDGDGACDKRTVFAEGKDFPVTDERKKAGLGAFDLATGLEVGHGKAFVGAPPYLWAIDITGENKDKPGKFEPVLKGFGSQDTHETLNTFQWGPDGWLYGMHGVFSQSEVKGAEGEVTRMNAAVWRYNVTQKKFEIYAEGTSNPWGLDWRNTDGQFILACCVIDHLYHIVPGAIYQRQAGASYNPHAYGHVKAISDHTFHKESGWAHAGLISLDAAHMPKRFQNSVVFGSIHGCSLKQNVLKPNGSSYTASRGDDFLNSADKNFRPINLKWGPNGDIYLIDWHDQNPCHQAKAEDWDYARGRVYRIQLKGRPAKKAEDLGAKTGAELAKLALGADPYAARTALRLLAAGGAKMADSAAGVMESSGRDMTHPPMAALTRAICTAAQVPERPFKLLPGEGGEDVTPLLRLFGPAGEAPAQTLATFVTVAGKTPHATVRRELAAAAVRLADKNDVAPLVHALLSRKEDAKDPLIPHLTWLAYEKVLAKKAGVVSPVEKELVSPVEKELAWLADNAAGNEFITEVIVPRAMRRLVALGQPRDLNLAVAFAAKATDAAVRKQALEGLATALDRQAVAAPEAWPALQAELAKANDARLTPLVNRLAVSFRDPAAVAKALKEAADAALGVEARALAVRQVAALKAPTGDALFVKLVANAEAPEAVRVEAARGLAAFEAPAIAAGVLKPWAKLPAPVRAELVPVLAGRKEWAKALLTAMQANTVNRGEVTDNTVLRMQAFNDKALNQLIEAAWGRVRATPADLTKTIDTMRGELSTGTASLAKGRQVFDANCAKCHKFEGKGQEVGPALDGAGRDIEYLLANVIDPNRVIGAPYFLRLANLADGSIEQGVLHEEDAQSLTLKVENGVLKRLAKADLDGPVRVVEKSMMPEGLTYGMTTQDFRDLVRYLMASPFLTHGTLDGQPLAAPPAGGVALAKGKHTLEFPFTAKAAATTQLLFGVPGTYAVSLDGVPLTAGTNGVGEADRERVAVKLAAGAHTLTITADGPGGKAFARLLDPDRAVSYPEAGK